MLIFMSGSVVRWPTLSFSADRFQWCKERFPENSSCNCSVVFNSTTNLWSHTVYIWSQRLLHRLGELDWTDSVLLLYCVCFWCLRAVLCVCWELAVAIRSIGNIPSLAWSGVVHEEVTTVWCLCCDVHSDHLHFPSLHVFGFVVHHCIWTGILHDVCSVWYSCELIVSVILCWKSEPSSTHHMYKCLRRHVIFNLWITCSIWMICACTFHTVGQRSIP